MTLRSFKGTRWPTVCACGCGSPIPASPDVAIVVDLDARPRRTWLYEHAPRQGADGPAASGPTRPSSPSREATSSVRSPTPGSSDGAAAARPSSGPIPKNFSRGEPRLLQVEGQRWPSKCACGCGSIIPAGDQVPIVVELGAKPRKVWIPEHSPQADTARASSGHADRAATSPEAA